MRVLTLLFLVMLVLTCSPTDAQEVRLPKDVTVHAPPADLPPAVAGFAGRFEGRWNGGVPHILVVRKISATKKTGVYEAEVVYGWGDSSGGGTKAGYREVDAEIVNGELVVPIQRVTVRYKLGAEGKSVDGIWQGTGAQYFGTFVRSSQ